MKKMYAARRVIAATLICLLFLSGCTGDKRAEQFKNTEEENDMSVIREEFDAYTDELFRTEVVENTINLHYILAYPENYGITDYEVTLGDFSREAQEEAFGELEELKRELAEFPREKLTKEQRLTYDILMDYADTELGARENILYTELLSPTTGYQAQLPVILAEYGFRRKQDIEDYLSLVSEMDEMFADVIAFEKEKSEAGLFMPDYAADAIIDQCEQFIEDVENNYMIEVFEDEIHGFDWLTEEEKEAYCLKNEELVTTDVVNGYQILIDGLEELKGTGTNEKGLCYYENGKEYYEYLIRTGVGTDLSVEELQKQTQTFIDRNIRNIGMAFQEKPELMTEFFDFEFPITEPEAILEDLNQKILKDFPKPPEVNYTIKTVHPSMEEHASPAFYLTTPLDDYANNIIYVNPYYLGGENEMDLYTVLAHEGYPGHLYQNVYTASCGLAPIRSLFSVTGYSEGWATYVENYAYGISGLDAKLADVLAWNNLASLGLYAYADMGVHADGWSREDLAEYFAEYGMEDEEITNQVYEMLVEEPANYLNYFVGYLEVLNLRNEMAEKIGNDFELKDFHEKFMSAGPAPFYLLEKYLLEE